MGNVYHQAQFGLNNLKQNESLGIGDDTWVCISELEEEIDVTPFFIAVRKFYLATLEKMFPFADTIM